MWLLILFSVSNTVSFDKLRMTLLQAQDDLCIWTRKNILVKIFFVNLEINTELGRVRIFMVKFLIAKVSHFVNKCT
ncbi:MAG: hypothetical protein DRJ05_08570 [Bacteroidetes bacterium]|nr:MAG: hypothetical protein DRJ05_08570 [Bacteroidota bacterium]